MTKKEKAALQSLLNQKQALLKTAEYYVGKGYEVIFLDEGGGRACDYKFFSMIDMETGASIAVHVVRCAMARIKVGAEETKYVANIADIIKEERHQIAIIIPYTDKPKIYNAVDLKDKTILEFPSETLMVL